MNIEKTVQSQRTNTGSETSAQSSVTYGTCANRLPCGFCIILNRACPMQNSNFNPMWVTTTPCTVPYGNGEVSGVT